MLLDKISLIHFRNHQSFNQSFETPQTIFVAPNGAGKTNILEAVYILATGDTFREAKSEEMVAFEAEVGHVAAKLREEQYREDNASLNSSQVQNDKSIELRATLTRGVWQGKRVAKKRYLVNGVGRSKAKFVGNFQAVCFRPEDMRIIEGSPTRRRKFFDEVISQVDYQYRVSSIAYGKALRQRNKLLVMIREKETHPRALEFWDDLVIEHGSYINKKRGEMVEAFNKEHLNLLSPSFEKGAFEYEMVYDHSIMSRDRLTRYKIPEMSAGHTLVGPHRDDFQVKSQVTSDKKLELKDLAIYGSRGQQRMGVLWLKIQSLAYIKAKTKQSPVLLLDDIFSELDHEHREMVFDLMKQQQTIATTADVHYVEGVKADIVRL